MSKKEKLMNLNRSFRTSLFEQKMFEKEEGKTIEEILAEKLSEKEINDFHEECIDAGNVTSYLYQIEGKPSNLKDHILNAISKNNLNGLLKADEPLAKDVTEVPRLHKITTTDRYVKFIFYWRDFWKNFISELDDGRIGDCNFPSFSKGICKICFDSDIIEMRVRNQFKADYIKDKIKELIDLSIIDLDFIGKLEKWIKKAVGISHSSIKLLRRVISKIKITKNPKAGQKELLEDEEFQRIEKMGEQVGVNIQVEVKNPYLKSESIITIKVNAEQGKIYFYNEVQEVEIEHVFNEVPKII